MYFSFGVWSFLSVVSSSISISISDVLIPFGSLETLKTLLIIDLSLVLVYENLVSPIDLLESIGCLLITYKV